MHVRSLYFVRKSGKHVILASVCVFCNFWTVFPGGLNPVYGEWAHPSLSTTGHKENFVAPSGCRVSPSSRRAIGRSAPTQTILWPYGSHCMHCIAFLSVGLERKKILGWVRSRSLRITLDRPRLPIWTLVYSMESPTWTVSSPRDPLNLLNLLECGHH